MKIESLPLYPRLGEIADTLVREGLLMLHAEPGAGKTTLVPWELVRRGNLPGKVLLLEPRRLAARAAADRVAELLGEKPGKRVGLRTRFDSIAGAALEVVTEGVLTRMLQSDPSLAGISTVIFDEFHERSLQGDLGLALAWEARKIFRPDLSIALMSATLPSDEIREHLGEMPLIHAEGRSFPVEVHYRPPKDRETMGKAVSRLVREAAGMIGTGDVLVFLPGMREIRRAEEALKEEMPAARTEILHGSLPPEVQRRILAAPEKDELRVILSTNLAETSVTLPAVRAVADMGLERRERFSPRTGMGVLETLPVSKASAEQRRGRAGRLGPGVCLRWWKEGEFRDDFRPPEIAEGDLASLVLETAVWGAANPFGLSWVTPPPAGSVKQASSLLKDLSFLDAEGRITDAGRKAAPLALHPRLARMVEAASDDRERATAALCAAILSEEAFPAGRNEPDLRLHIEAVERELPGTARLAGEARRVLRSAGARDTDALLRLADAELAGECLLSAFPDRAAKRQKQDAGGHSSRWVLANGNGAVLEGPLSREDFLVAADVEISGREGRILLAAPISRARIDDGKAGAVTERLVFGWTGWVPHARSVPSLGKLALSDGRGVKTPPKELAEAALEKLRSGGIGSLPLSGAAKNFIDRARFVWKYGKQANWPDFSDEILLAEAPGWLIPFGHFEGSAVFTEQNVFQALETRLGWDRRSKLDNLAPESLTLPSGMNRRLDYSQGDVPVLAARLQEFFGCVTTPRICGEAVLLHLLSPAGRPVQITRDLDGFWDRAYPEVKKELKGRYPRHYWPDDPREAEATARAKPRGK
jgi:ATP-dependent helicase HrpB